LGNDFIFNALFDATMSLETMSLESPTVSIIVWGYHQGTNYLPATIKSILQQTYEEFEVLMVQDSHPQFLSWFEEQIDPRLRIFSANNLSLAHVLNQGIFAARGQYISFIVAGDLWHPKKLQQQILCLADNPEISLIHSAFMLIGHQGPDIGKIVSPIKEGLRPPEILAQNQIALSSVMVRRSCFERAGLFDPQLQTIPDWELWIRLSHLSNHGQFMAIAKRSRREISKGRQSLIAEPLVYCRQIHEASPQYWLTLEIDLHSMIETAYANLSSERSQQKHRSYGYASLFLAQNVLQHKNPDLAIARNYCYQALEHDPYLLFSLKFCQLRWRIWCLHWRLFLQQSDLYHRLRRLIQEIVNRGKEILHKTKELSQMN
jgi:glycosyltransferase involved in cell wall biosynthesis